MSFFVSKDLEGKIDASCLIPNKEIPVDYEFVLKFENSICNITEINFYYDIINTINFKIDCNIHILDKFFNGYVEKGIILFKNSYLDLTNIKIEKIFKRESDIYILEVSAVYHRGNV